MAAWRRLPTLDKVIVYPVMGVCSTVYMLNEGSEDLQKRRAKAARKLLDSGQAQPNDFQIVNGRLVAPERFQKTQEALAPSKLFDTIWTPSFVHNWLALSQMNIYEGRWQTTLTSGFCHGSASHLLFNMLGLWSVAPAVIAMAGVPALIGVWTVAGLGGSIASLIDVHVRFRAVMNQKPPDLKSATQLYTQRFIGASGSLFGLFAACAVLSPSMKMQFMFIPYPIAARTLLGVTLGGSILASGLGLFPGIGHWGHVGGMVSGALAGIYLKSGIRASKTMIFLVLGCSGLYLSRSVTSKTSGEVMN